MQRILVPPGALHTGELVIRDRREVRHAAVRRMRPGERVECFDGEGARAQATVVRVGGGQLVVAIGSVTRDAPAAGTGLRAAVALIHPSRFDWMVEKLTELGVSRITPLVTERCTVRPGRSDSTARVSRWRRLAAAAAKQCGTDAVPSIDAPQPFSEWLNGLPEEARILMPTLAVPAPPVRTAAAGWLPSDDLTIVIGPEGDFTAKEVTMAQARGARVVSLGRRTLRTETAAIALVAVLRHISERV